MDLPLLYAVKLAGVVTNSSSRPLVVDTERGRFLVKLIHGPEGPRALAAEWLGTALASHLGLPTLELAQVVVEAALGRHVAESELREQIERGAGLCLGARWLEGARSATARTLERAPEEFAARVLWLDVLIQNPDRRTNNPNVLERGSALLPIDHGASLPFHHAWRVSEQDPASDLKPPLDHPFGRHAARLAFWHRQLEPLVTWAALERMCQALPEPWLGRVQFETVVRQRLAYAAYLRKRVQAMGAIYV